MTRVLCVDDEPRVLSGLRRQLHGEEGGWALECAQGAEEALDRLDDGGVDVLVTDLCMPGMDGAALLSRLLDVRPRTVRLVLSGHADPERLRAARARAHRCMEKPCPPGTLADAIRAALAVREVVERPGHAMLARLWCTPPDRVPAAQPLLPLLFGRPETCAAQELLEDVLASDPRLSLRLAALLQAALHEPLPASPQAGAQTAPRVTTPLHAPGEAMPPAPRATEVLVPLLVSLRLFETLLAGERAWDEALTDARRAATRAVERGETSAARAAAAAAGLLLPSGAPPEAAGALAWLLTSWGVPASAEPHVARALHSPAA